MQSPEQDVQKWLRGELSSMNLFGLNPESMQALAEHGYLLYEQGKYSRAQIIFEALTSLDRNNAEYQKLLGSIYQIQKKWDAAYYRYTIALQTLPDDIYLLVNRGETLLKLQRQREAREDLKKAVLQDPSGTHPAGKRARILLSLPPAKTQD